MFPSHGGKQNRASRARTMALVVGVRVGSAVRKQMDRWPPSQFISF